MDILDLFPDRVSPEPNSGCWLWDGPNRSQWRGGLWENGVQHYAHRYSWERSRGPIPAGLFVLHHCDVPFCVNPDHLFLGDQWDNMQDMAIKSRRARISNETVREIREMYATGRYSQNEVAARFRIGQSTVAGIVSGFRRRYA